jgi:hypothetical protein
MHTKRFDQKGRKWHTYMVPLYCIRVGKVFARRQVYSVVRVSLVSWTAEHATKVLHTRLLYKMQVERRDTSSVQEWFVFMRSYNTKPTLLLLPMMI